MLLLPRVMSKQGHDVLRYVVVEGANICIMLSVTFSV